MSTGTDFANNKFEMMPPLQPASSPIMPLNLQGAFTSASNNNTIAPPAPAPAPAPVVQEQSPDIAGRAAMTGQSLNDMSGVSVNPKQGDVGFAMSSMGNTVKEAITGLFSAFQSKDEGPGGMTPETPQLPAFQQRNAFGL